jgi:hypothetical protein
MCFSVNDVKADILAKIVMLWQQRKINRIRKDHILEHLDDIAMNRWCRKR